MADGDLSLNKGLSTEEFFDRVQKRYGLFDENGSAYLNTLNTLIMEQRPLDEIRSFALKSDVRSALNTCNEYITFLKLLKISEEEEAVGETPVLRCAPSVSELAVIDKIVFLYLLRIEFDFAKEDFCSLSEYVLSNGLSPLYLSNAVTEGVLKRPKHIFDTLIDLFNEKGQILISMKLKALKERFTGTL